MLGFLLAAWVYRLRDLPGMAIVRTLLTTPILIAPIVAAVMWRFMYQPDFGVITYLIELTGLPRRAGSSIPTSPSSRLPPSTCGSGHRSCS